MSTLLKIKAKTLAAEATIIRKEERKALRTARWLKNHQQDSDKAYTAHRFMQDHRKGAVRREARYTHVARAYLKGLTYHQCETPSRSPLKPVHIEDVARMVATYGWDRNHTLRDTYRHVEMWIKASIDAAADVA